MADMGRQTARGREEPFAVQFSVFLANRVGQLRDLLLLLDKHEIDLLGISIVDSTDWAVIRMVLSDPDKARELLKGHGLPFTESEVLLVEVEGTHSLAGACGVLLQTEINVHFAYPLTLRSHGNPVIVFHVDDHLEAGLVLRQHHFTILGEEDLADPGRGDMPPEES